MKEEITTLEIMNIIESVLVEMYNSEYDAIKMKIEELLISKK